MTSNVKKDLFYQTSVIVLNHHKLNYKCNPYYLVIIGKFGNNLTMANGYLV